MSDGASVGIEKAAVYVDPSKILSPISTVVDKTVNIGLKKLAPFIPASTSSAPSTYVPFVGEEYGKRGLIVNIETSGFDPITKQLLCIGWQDPLHPESLPNILIGDTEENLLKKLFGVVKLLDVNQLIGYGFSFDFQWFVVKAFKYGLAFKETFSCEILDLMQVAAQGKTSFVYRAQRPPSLSDLSAYLWNYPKPFTDLEMIKYFFEGRLDKVAEFTSSQITRILNLYYVYRNLTENPAISLGAGDLQSPLNDIAGRVESPTESISSSGVELYNSGLVACKNCLAEVTPSMVDGQSVCPVCRSLIN